MPDKMLRALKRVVDRGGSPCDAMAVWVKGEQLKGLLRLPIPEINAQTKAVFESLLRQRDAIAEGKNPKLRNTIWLAMNMLTLQCLVPSWTHGRIVDIVGPHDVIDDAYIANTPGNTLYPALFMARSQSEWNEVMNGD